MVVVGAGMAGLMAARRLVDAGRRVMVYEKGRVVGGRMASRRVGDAFFDYGAQYFTARGSEFRALVEGWVGEGLVGTWSDGFAGADGEFRRDGEARYMGLRGMSTVPMRVAEGLPVRTGATAVACSRVEGRWLVRFKERFSVAADALVLTLPVPQSLALLAAGGVVLDAAAAVALTRIEYAPCLAALVRLVGPSRVPEPGGIWLEGEPASWIGDNTRKGISEARLGASVTIHAGAEFSRRHWEGDLEEVGRELAHEVREWLGSEVTGIRLHRWRYARPTVLHPARYLLTRSPGLVAFAGDAFDGPRVEGAVVSGLAAGDAVSAG